MTLKEEIFHWERIWWDWADGICLRSAVPQREKNITTGFCVVLTADHEQFFLSGCPNLLSQGVQWIQMWGIKQLACGPGSPGEDSCHSRCPLKKPVAWRQRLTDCRTDCWLIRSVVPATDQKLAETCSAKQADETWSKSSALQDTE